MANPQKENGFIPIATELFEALCGIRIPGEARQCFDIIIRKTYGYNKTWDRISLSQFCLLAKMPKPEVCRSLRKLAKMDLIIGKKANDGVTLYRLNKDFHTWKPLAKKPPPLAKKPKVVGKEANASLAKKPHTIDNTTKDKSNKRQYCDLTVAEVIPDLLKDKQKHVQIIGLYARAKKVLFKSRKHQQSFIRRNLRAAQDLVEYEPPRLIRVMKFLLDRADFKWTLETVGKYVDEDLDNLKTNKKGITILH